MSEKSALDVILINLVQAVSRNQSELEDGQVGYTDARLADDKALDKARTEILKLLGNESQEDLRGAPTSQQELEDSRDDFQR